MNRYRDVKNLLKSKCYILITDKEGTMVGNFDGFTGMMKIHTLKEMHAHTEELLKKIGADPAKKKRKKESKNVRNSSGRTTSRKKE